MHTMHDGQQIGHRKLATDIQLQSLLLNLLELQLWKGCNNPNCQEQLCASYKRQHSFQRPQRELTRLTARAAAFYLATLDNAESFICPKIWEKFLPEVQQDQRPDIGHALQQIAQEFDRLALIEYESAKKDPVPKSSKDPKSLPQHLLDTHAVRKLLRPETTSPAHLSPSATVRRAIKAIQELQQRYRQTRQILDWAGQYDGEVLEQVDLQRTGIKVAEGATAFAKYMQEQKYGWDPGDYEGDVIAMKLTASLAQVIAIEGRPDSALGSLTMRETYKRCSLAPFFPWLLRSLYRLFSSTWNSKPTIATDATAAQALSFLHLISEVHEFETTILSALVHQHPTLLNSSLLVTHALKFWKQVANKDNKFDSTDRHGPVTIGGTICVTEFPMVLKRETIIQVFRGICLHRMREAMDDGLLNQKMLHRGFKDLRDPQSRQLPPQVSSLQRGRLMPAFAISLAIQVRREHLLSDFYDELWRRQKRELLRPLRVRLVSEWEIGNDQGGVSQEVLRLAISEVLQPSHGMFSLDEQSRMMWFNPGSLEPPYKFELTGLLVALAVHNGYNMPLSFPQTLYRRLLGKQTKSIRDIEDGWPDVARGLRQLQEYDDDDLEATFSLDWTFSSLRLDGTTQDSDMMDVLPSKRVRVALIDDIPSGKLSGSHPVTLQNRDLYIEAYLEVLTYESVRPQIEAFAKGFHTILPPAVLRTTTPTALESLVQGVYEDIDTEALQRVTQYPDEIYTAKSEYIRSFWSIVHDLPQDRKKKLLEFVTASDRLPVTGNVIFKIEKSYDDEKLPTSHTCFGILRLPEYASRDALETKLNIALDNAEGFGIL